MDHSHDIGKEKRKYWLVFLALGVLTVITVALAKLEVGIALAVTLGLIVATSKASLVASIFMHLIAEKKIIYVTLGFTAFFFIIMMFLIVAGKYDTPQGTEHRAFLMDEPVSKDDHHDHAHDAHAHDKHEEGHH